MNNKLSKLCKTSAQIHGVSASVHPEDMIMQFVLNNPVFPDSEAAINYYFQVGKESTNNLLSVLESLGMTSRPISLLEFASGYGCVSRHLTRLTDRIDLTSCDIHPEAISFLNQEIGMKQTILSAHKPEDFSCDNKFDVVFALSFFSHMPRRTWGKWLDALFDKVKPGGYLLFTTQGMESAKHLGSPAIPSDGFWFSATSEQKDLDTSEYGQTICKLEFVASEINKRLKVPLTMYRSGYWWGHQDLYAIAKPIPEKDKPTKAEVLVNPKIIKLSIPDSEIWARVNDSNFVKTISPKDSMALGVDSEKIYYWMGFTAVDSILEILKTAGKSVSDVKNILDFACGYGRVCRALRATFPHSAITACDIEREGANFCAKHFGATPAYSSEKSDGVHIDGTFDLIWVGSLFTHLPEKDWMAYLRFLGGLLKPGGILTFSVAGKFVYDMAVSGDYFGLLASDMPNIERDYKTNGFAYAKYPVSVTSYGNIGRTFVSESWVRAAVSNVQDLDLICMIERGYSRRQDVIGCIKR